MLSQLKSELIAHPLSDPKGFEETVGPVEANIAISEDLAPYKFNTEWHCRAPDPIMGKIVSRNALTQIQSLTGTQLLEDNRQVIHISAHSKEACDLAVHKLDVLQKYHVS